MFLCSADSDPPETAPLQVPGEAALWFEHPTRVELSYGDRNRQYKKENLYTLPDGTFPSKGWSPPSREFGFQKTQAQHNKRNRQGR